MKKAALSFFVFAASAVYVVYQYFGGNTVSATVTATTPPPKAGSQSQGQTNTQTVATTQTPPTQTKPAQTQTQTPTPTQTPAPTPTPTPPPKPKGQYADGSYTGSVADAYYGNVQVKVSIQGGKIAAVDFLQYPNDRSTSRYINSQAMPLLEQEAIQVQSANVSGVSGATDTSMAFVQSLSDALAKAKNA